MLKRTTKPLRRRVLIEESLARSSNKQHSENTDKWHLCKAGSFSYSESLWTPPLEGTSLHRWNNSVERPWGILSLFTTCLRLCVKSTATGCDTCGQPLKSTLRGEKHQEMLPRTKPQEELGTRRCIKKNTQRKHSELKEPDEMLNKTKTLTTIVWQKKAKEKALQKPLWEEQSPTKC